MKGKNQISAAKLLLIPGVILGSVMFTTQEAQAATFISIDNFDTTPLLETEFVLGDDPGVQTDFGTFSEDDVFGGTRAITHTLESGVFGTSSTVGLVGPDLGVLSLSDGAGVTSTLSVLYDAGGAGLGRDLSPFLADGFFAFDVVSIDLAAELTLTITDGSGGVSSSTLTDIDDIAAVSFPLDTFVGGADVSDIFSLELEISGDEALDVTIDAIGFDPGEVVPEPATVLGLVTLAGLAVASKKGKKA